MTGRVINTKSFLNFVLMTRPVVAMVTETSAVGFLAHHAETDWATYMYKQPTGVETIVYSYDSWKIELCHRA